MSADAVHGSLLKAFFWLVLLAGLVAVQAAWAQSAGRVISTQRLVWLQKPDGSIQPLARGAAFETGDVISTGRSSTAQLLFSDGGDVTLRPDSQLRIERYGYRVESPESDNAFFRLLKGGMRAVTGLIGKRGNRDAYRVGAATATIGIRGTDFTARICAEDCAQESQKIPPNVRSSVALPAARTALVRGRVTATDARGAMRDLEQNAALYQGDTVRTEPDGYAFLVFRDEGRMTLAGGAVFAIEQFRYEQARPAQNSVVLRLLQGGLRSLTGLIAKRRPEAFRVNTPVATIGVRGSGWSVNLVPLPPQSPDAPPASGGGPSTPNVELILHTWEGTAVLDTPGGRFDVGKDQTASLSNRDPKPVVKDGVPDIFDDAIAPRPDRPEVNFKELFADSPDKFDPGLYVLVRDGGISVAQGDRDVTAEKGEGVYADDKGGTPRKLPPPRFLELDPWLLHTANICR